MLLLVQLGLDLIYSDLHQVTEHEHKAPDLQVSITSLEI